MKVLTPLYVPLLRLWNSAKTYSAGLQFSGTADRTHTLQDRDGTLADNTDLALKANLDRADRASIQPTLDLDFARQRYAMYDADLGGLVRGFSSLGDILTYTGSGRTYVDALGILRAQSSNVPRIEFDPVTGAGLGLSVWGARTNMVTYSNDFSNASWAVATNLSKAYTVADPMGGTTATTLTATSADAMFGRTVTGTIGNIHTTSFWIRRRTGSGPISLFAGPNAGIPITSQISTTWTRISGTGTAIADTTVRCYVRITTSGDAVDIWNGQLEVGASASPYTATTTVAVTAPADVAVLSGTNFSKWYRQSEGTFVYLFGADVGPDSGASNARIVVSDGTSNNRRILYGYSNVSIAGGVADGNASSGSNYIGRVWRAAAYSPTEIVFSTTGGNVVIDSSFTSIAATLTQVSLGNNIPFVNDITLNGTITRVLYFPRRLTNAELQVLSEI